jgi:hypothetical protein
MGFALSVERLIISLARSRARCTHNPGVGKSHHPSASRNNSGVVVSKRCGIANDIFKNIEN